MSSDIDRETGRSVWSRLRLPFFALVAAGAVVGWFVVDPLESTDEDSNEEAVVRDSAQIRVADLSESFDAEGSLVFADANTIQHPGAGTITAIVEPGVELVTGTELYSVDNVPTVVLPGAVPAWRTMGVDAVGDDVAQLELALVEMGYDALGLLSVDDTYTSYTADLVELWQADLGVDETGVVEFGSVVFSDGQREVGSVFGEVGQAPPPAGMLSVRSVDREVVFTVDEWPSLDVGDVVTGRLPDRTEVDVAVVQIESDGAGTWTLTGSADSSDLPTTGAEEVPVDISWEADLGRGLLVAPAASIKRVDSQNYVVEIVLDEAAGTTAFVPVELGQQSGSLVEVSGDIAEGATVITP